MGKLESTITTTTKEEITGIYELENCSTKWWWNKTVLFSVLNHQDQYNKMIRSEDLFATIIQFSVDRWDLVALTFSKTCHIIPHFYIFFFNEVFSIDLQLTIIIWLDCVWFRQIIFLPRLVTKQFRGLTLSRVAICSPKATQSAKRWLDMQVSDCLAKHCKLWNLSWSCFSTDLQRRIIWFWLFLTFFQHSMLCNHCSAREAEQLGLCFQKFLEKVNVNLTWKGYGAF